MAEQMEPIKQEEGVTREEWIQKIRFSARGYKARLTMAAKAAEKALDLFTAGPTNLGASELKNDLANMESAFRPLQYRLHELMDNASSEQDFTDHEADLKDYTKRYDKLRATVMAAIDVAAPALLPQKSQVTGTKKGRKEAAGGGPDDDNDADSFTTADGDTRQFKVNTALKPEKLTTESTPRDLTSWIDQFTSYYETSFMSEVSIKAQQAYLKQCLDKTLRFRLEQYIDTNTPIFGDLDSCISVIKAEFEESYPIFTRRLEFFRAMQPKKQSMSDFISHCKQLWIEGDMHNLKNNDLLLFKYYYSCTDDELRKEMLKLESPGIHDVERFVKRYEVSKRENKEITKSSPTTSTAQAAQVKKSQKKGKKDNSKQPQDKGSLKSKMDAIVKAGGCRRCGSSNHDANNCRHVDTTCYRCDKKGHTKWVCLSSTSQANKTSNTKTSPAEEPEASTGKASQVVHRVAKVQLSDPTPRLDCKIIPPRGPDFTFHALPDTGATVTVISHDLAQRKGLEIKPAPNEQLLSADETGLNVAGHTRFNVNGTHVKAIVSKSLKNELLIGWRDLMRLGIIPETFPNRYDALFATQATISEQDMDERLNTLYEEFADVLNDELPDRPMHGPDMHIELRDDVPIKPRHATTTKPIPLHFQEAADALLDSLLHDKIIEPVPMDEVSDWDKPSLLRAKRGG